MWQDYDLCRTKQFVSFEKPTGRSDGSKKLVLAEYPTGFARYPREGGLDEQDYYTMKIFHAFLRGERQGVAQVMSQK